MSSSACGKSGMRFWSVHSLGKGWQGPELLEADLAAIAKKKKKKENGLSQRGCSSEMPTRAGCSVVLNHPNKTISPKNHSFTLLALQEVPLLHPPIWFPCRAL